MRDFSTAVAHARRDPQGVSRTSLLLSGSAAIGLLSGLMNGSQAIAADAPPASAAVAAPAPSVDTLVVTGARYSTSTFQSLAPVQAVSGAVITQTNKPDLRTALSEVTPAYLASQTANGSSRRSRSRPSSQTNAAT